MNWKKIGQCILALLVCVCVTAGFAAEDVYGEGGNLKRPTEMSVEFGTLPVYTGKQIHPDDFIRTKIYAATSDGEREEISGLTLSYSFYRYRSGKPDGPDEDSDKLDWDKTPVDVGTYWVKVKFLGDNSYKPCSSGYLKFSIGKATPELKLSTNMTADTKIGDTITVTAQFVGVDAEEADFQPAGKVVFQAGGRYLAEAVPFSGSKAQINYKLTSEMVDIKAEYLPAGKNENYTAAETTLTRILGNKRLQEKLRIGCNPVAYGADPFLISVSGGSGNGAVTYHSSNEKVATINKKGKITVLAPGKTTITVTKAGDKTYTENRAEYLLKVAKGINPGKPKLPVLLENTANKIRVKKTEGQEFSIDGGKTWNRSGVFKNLRAKKKYTVITRFTETAYYQPGRTTKFLEVTTARKGEKKDAESADSSKRIPQVSAGKKNQWHSLGGEAKPAAGTDRTAALAAGNDRKTETAAGALKGSNGQELSKTPDTPEIVTEDGTLSEAAEEEYSDEIMSTGASRPVKKSVPGAAVFVLVIVIAGAGISFGWYRRNKRRRSQT